MQVEIQFIGVLFGDKAQRAWEHVQLAQENAMELHRRDTTRFSDIIWTAMLGSFETLNNFTIAVKDQGSYPHRCVLHAQAMKSIARHLMLLAEIPNIQPLERELIQDPLDKAITYYDEMIGKLITDEDKPRLEAFAQSQAVADSFFGSIVFKG